MPSSPCYYGSEWDYRYTQMVNRLTKQAGFRYNAYMEDIDYDTPRNLNRNQPKEQREQSQTCLNSAESRRRKREAQLERLATLEFVRAGQDVFITGPTGTGKSTLAEALAHRACENGMRTYYASAPKLMNKLKGAKAKGTYDADMKKIEKSALLVLDDLFILGLD